MVDYQVLSMDSIGGPVTVHDVGLDIKDVPWAKEKMWAPDAAEKDGKYYLYFPVKDKEGVFRIGAAVGDKPEGPFKAQPEAIKNSFSMDPAVFKDTDGKYYMYFGGLWGGQLQHWKTGKHTPQDDSQPPDDQPALSPKIARMADNMVEFAEKPKDVKIVDENGKPLLSGDHDRRFFEAAWVHKYNGNYYLSYSTGDSHFIAYAMGKSPYGPFTYKGNILMPVLGWTNHHSIVEVDGKWYLFYHDAQISNGVNHLRNVKQPVEIKYNEDGTIQPIDPYLADDIGATALPVPKAPAAPAAPAAPDAPAAG
jgi:beta-xylosidase